MMRRALLLVSMTVILAGCGEQTADTRAAATTAAATTTITTSAAASAAASAGPGTACGRVGKLPVVVTAGSVDCGTALKVAAAYSAAIDAGADPTSTDPAVPQGQGLFATILGWDCSWPMAPGRSHADSPLACTHGSAALRIGS